MIVAVTTIAKAVIKSIFLNYLKRSYKLSTILIYKHDKIIIK